MTDEEVEDFIAINFSEYFKCIREEQSLRKVLKLLYTFRITPDKVEIYVQYNSTNNCVHHYNVRILNCFRTEL